MRDVLLGKLLPLLVKATPGDLAAIHRFLTRQPLPGPQQVAPGLAPVREARPSRAGTRAGSEHVFRRKGRLWEVIFADGQSFYLQDTPGARYLNHLLHEPNKAISAFGLEGAIEPEKGKARSRNSVQSKSDAQAQREYRQELGRLEADREAARAAGQRKEVGRLDGQIEALESVLGEAARWLTRVNGRAATSTRR